MPMSCAIDKCVNMRGLSPEIWGPWFWKVIHVIAWEQNERDRHLRVEFIGKVLPEVLPCRKCAKNYRRHLKNVPKSNDDLALWTINLHNATRRCIGTDIVVKNKEDVRDIYGTPSKRRDIWDMHIWPVIISIVWTSPPDSSAYVNALYLLSKLSPPISRHTKNIDSLADMIGRSQRGKYSSMCVVSKEFTQAHKLTSRIDPLDAISKTMLQLDSYATT